MAKTKTQTESLQTTQEEHLSAFFDGESGAFEERRLLDELESNSSLQNKLSSYALIGETMRSSESSVIVGSNFLDSIHERITQEDEYHEVQLQAPKNDSQNSSSWIRPVGGFAIAASVVAIATIGFQSYYQPSSTYTTASVQTKQAVNTSSINDDSSKKVMIASGYQKADSHTRLLLKRYVDLHMQQASTSSFVPSVRVIAYAD